jgi:hypothetical protein
MSLGQHPTPRVVELPSQRPARSVPARGLVSSRPTLSSRPALSARPARALGRPSPGEALQAWVTRLVDSGGLRAVVLADHDGLVVAGATSDPRVDLEVLAAVQGGRDVQVLPLRLGEVRLSLVVQGTRRLSPEPVRAALARLLDLA